ncbi:uroporphyrinogen-III C-methyltransferase [Leptolyngbya sp. AN02str]|uniref:uroporphyrinogen-III C-methyltransferase n=1 Tax=Leptolyngbya sp. AN02str TaxID=3423363 RepID=UPI003D314704
MDTGKVYIVGAGPGSLEYLTVRGYSLIQRAEAVVYDALIDSALLDLAPAHCETYDVGKRGGRPSLKQPKIDQLLVDLCQQGKVVVRLKSGDPFIFGRTASEIQALRSHNLPVELVPGISSALAAPLFEGIPLTDPTMSRCVVLLSAHEPDRLDWEALARMDTLVILMGAQQLGTIVQQLMNRGRSPQTPVAVTRWAGHPQQQTWTGTLQSIQQVTAHQPLSPAIITIGEVVSLRPYLIPASPSHNRYTTFHSSADVSSLPVSDSIRSASSAPAPSASLPLHGKTVLITRSAGQSSQFAELLMAQGTHVLEMPAIEIGPPSSWAALDDAIAQIHRFQWLVLTSTNGVDYFFERLAQQEKDARALAGIKLAVVGKKTAQRLHDYGLRPDFIPPDFVADSLVEHFPDSLVGCSILFPRVETGGRDVLVKLFRDQGAAVSEVSAYQSDCATTLPNEVRTALEQRTLDAVTFASSKTVKCFQHILHQANVSLPDSCAVASIGPQTTTACLAHLGRVSVEAEEYTLEGLTLALVRWATAQL